MRNQEILKFLQDAEQGLVTEVPNHIPRGRKAYKSERGPYSTLIIDRSIKVCTTRCAVCHTQYPLIWHHIFNSQVAARLKLTNPERNKLVVCLCPNCHYIVHETGTSKPRFD